MPDSGEVFEDDDRLDAVRLASARHEEAWIDPLCCFQELLDGSPLIFGVLAGTVRVGVFPGKRNLFHFLALQVV